MFTSIPRYETFYALFERAGANVAQATALLGDDLEIALGVQHQVQTACERPRDRRRGRC